MDFLKLEQVVETGKMKFTVRRYDPVHMAEDVSPLRKADTADGVLNLDSNPGVNGQDSIGSSFYSTGAIGGRHEVAHRGRLFARRHKRRLVFKDGKINISLSNISKRKRRYLGDLFSTFLDMKWRWNIMMFMLTFLVSWVVFALLWWLIAVIHHDNEHVGDDNWQFCMIEVYDFTTALLFSVETQHTIGYGSRSMNTKCPEAVILLMVQSCTGVFIQSMVTGIIFAKLSRPKGRSHTVMFSKTAVICQRDGIYCLLFRIADMRKSHIVGATLRAMMVRNRITKEGELLPLGSVPFNIQPETCESDGNLFLVWPVTVTHTIDETSPFWEMSSEQLITERFEIVVFLEGTVESSGMSAQVRTSYLPSEIQWGHRLATLFTYQKENGQYKIDYTVFHDTHPVPMPECSAKAFSSGDQEVINAENPKDVISNYHTENCGVHKPASLFKHRLHRRNTTDIGGNGRLSSLEEAEARTEMGTDGGSPSQSARTPKWLKGFVNFWSSSDLGNSKDYNHAEKQAEPGVEIAA